MNSNFESVIHDADGIIAWRRGTGDNVELTYVLVAKSRRGDGRRLFRKMLKELEERPPYHSVYGFTRAGNEEAREFYLSLGFELQPIDGVYKEGRAMLFDQSFEELKRLNKEQP